MAEALPLLCRTRFNPREEVVGKIIPSEIIRKKKTVSKSIIFPPEIRTAESKIPISNKPIPPIISAFFSVNKVITQLPTIIPNALKAKHKLNITGLNR